MKLKELILILSVMLIVPVLTGTGYARASPPAEEWNRTCEMRGITSVESFQQTADTGYILAGSASAGPPPALLKINGNEQTSGIGSYCWKVENETYSICSDTIGIITPAEPLLTRSPFTAHLTLPLQEPLEELGFSATRVTDDDELREAVNDVRAWGFQGNRGNWYRLPLEREPDMNLSLEPGLYVLVVGAKWEDIGSVTYGFLVQVNDQEAEVTNNVTKNVSSGEKTAGFEVFLAIMTLLLVIVIRRNRR